MKLYFVRHGESTANRLHEFCNTDGRHPLTEAGVVQARQLAGELEGLWVERIFTSPVLRARQTAEILAERLAAPLEVSEALREWSVGVYEGTTDPAGWEQHRRVQEAWFERHELDARLPGGESFEQIRQRFVPLIEGLLASGGPPDQNLVLVAHGGIYTAMLPLVLTNIDHDFARRHPLAHASPVVAETGPHGLTCSSWCGLVPDRAKSI